MSAIQQVASPEQRRTGFTQRTRLVAAIVTPLEESNGTLIWKVRSSFTDEPIELMVDTGAQVSILAEDKVRPGTKIMGNPIKIYGIAGEDEKISTHGKVIGKVYPTRDQGIITQIHIVNRKYSGPLDGFLGMDFLQTYNAVIDSKQKILILRERSDEEIDLVTNDGMKLELTSAQKGEPCEISANEVASNQPETGSEIDSENPSDDDSYHSESNQGSELDSTSESDLESTPNPDLDWNGDQGTTGKPMRNT